MKLAKMLGFAFIFLLILLGMGRMMNSAPLSVIIPVLLIGLIVYWIKYPPAFLTKSKVKSKSTKQQLKTKKERPRSKTVPFKVIEGGRDDNDTPRYH